MVILNIVLGCLCIIATIPPILGLIPPNRWYGIRTPEAFQSEQNWYRINRWGAEIMAVYGAAVIVSGFLPRLLNWKPDFGGLVFIWFLPVPLAILPVLVIVIYSRTKFGH